MSDEVLVEAPMNQARRRLLYQVRRDGLHGAASRAFADGLPDSGPAVSSELRLEVNTLPSYRSGVVTVVPLRWYASSAINDDFPAIDANLELQHAEPGTSRLGFTGSYRQASGQPMTRTQEDDMRGAIRQFLCRLATILTDA